MGEEWTLEDHTKGKNGGYWQLRRDGKRVADFFPYAKDVDAAWVIAQAQLIAKTMNGVA